MKTNIKILQDFLTYLSCVKNCSKITIRDYCVDLTIFFEFLINYLELNINLEDINVFILGNIESVTIISFLVYLNNFKNNGASTRGRKLSSIRTFYRWLFSKYYNVLKNKTNPCFNLPVIEKQLRLPKYLKLEDAKNLQHIFTKYNCKNPIRNNTIIIMFLNCGLRLFELSNISLKDINISNKTLRVIGKGNRERVIYLNQACISSIKAYLKIRNSNNSFLFINSNSEQLKERTIQDICKRAFKLAGLSSFKYSTHTLRHTAATYLYKDSKNILVVKEFLGHKNIKSTEIYTHINNEKIRDAVKSNPLANF